MPEQAYTAKTPTTTPVTTPAGWPAGWAWPGPPWPPGWPQVPWIALALGADEADVDGSFNIVVTAYAASGAVDTTYATQVDLTHDSADLSLQTPAGNPLSSIAGASFVNGVATVAARMHHATILAADEVVAITATEHGSTTVLDSDTITINNTAYTDPGVSHVEEGTTYRFDSVTKTGTLKVHDLDAVAIASFCYVDEANPATNYSGTFAFQKGTSGLGAIEKRLYLKFAQPLSKFRALVIPGITYPLLGLNLFRSGEGALTGSAVVYWDFIESDFDPATLTWNGQAALTVEADPHTGHGDAIAYGNDVYTEEHIHARGDLKGRQHVADVTPAANIYGIRLRLTVTASDGAGGGSGLVFNNTTTNPVTGWQALGTKA